MSNNWKDFSKIKSVIELLNQDGFIVFLDLETTGRSSINDRILQFSAIRCKARTLEVIATINIFVKCPFSVPEEITEINHIDDELLEREGLKEVEAFQMIHNFIKPDDIISGYYSKRFDEKFLEVLYKNHGQKFTGKESLDVYDIAKNIINPESVMIYDPKTRRQRSSYTLSQCVKYYDPENNFKFHDASHDILATKFLLEQLLEDGKNMIDQAQKEEKLRQEIPRQKVEIISIGYYSRSQSIRRVYVNTDQGIFYYDDVKHVWVAKQGNVDSIDMEDLKNQVFQQAGVTTEDDLVKEMRKRGGRK